MLDRTSGLTSLDVCVCVRLCAFVCVCVWSQRFNMSFKLLAYLREQGHLAKLALLWDWRYLVCTPTEDATAGIYQGRDTKPFIYQSFLEHLNAKTLPPRSLLISHSTRIFLSSHLLFHSSLPFLSSLPFVSSLLISSPSSLFSSLPPPLSSSPTPLLFSLPLPTSHRLKISLLYLPLLCSLI